MKNLFENLFNKKGMEIKKNTEGTLYPNLSISSKRLLGLKEFEKLSIQEIKKNFPKRRTFKCIFEY